MRISMKDWKRYIKMLSAVDKKAANTMQNWMDMNPDADVEELIWVATNVAGRYGEAAGALACEMYDAVAAAQGVSVPPAKIAEVPDYGETAKAVRGTIKNKQNTVPSTVGRLVKRVGADTMLKNAQRDGAQFAWVPMGDTCAFCMTLASRGWQYMSKDAMKRGHAEHIHANCDCTYAVRFDERSTVEGYEPERYREMYDNAEGDTPHEKINSMRRANYAQNKDRINTQKRAAYAKRKAIDSGAKGAIIEGKYNPADIRKAKRQESTNFVIRDNNHPDSVFGEVCDLVPKENGFYDVKMHGSPTKVKIFNSPVDSRELGHIIMSREDYEGGPIRLLSCETGKLENGTCVAMELSKMLGVDAMAPTEDIYVLSKGRLIIESARGEKGWMRTFHPDGSYEDDI